MKVPSSHLLRKGRVSLKGYFYLITTVTHQRKRFFTDTGNARTVVTAMKYCDETALTRTIAFVLMPDHLHWLFQLGGDRTLDRVIQSVKSYSARRISGGSGQVWQRGYHDHAIRTHSELKASARYVVANPLRAGICERIGDYPWWDAIWLDGNPLLE